MGTWHLDPGTALSGCGMHRRYLSLLPFFLSSRTPSSLISYISYNFNIFTAVIVIHIFSCFFPNVYMSFDNYRCIRIFEGVKMLNSRFILLPFSGDMFVSI